MKRLDPRQYIPYNLNTPSGNIDITQGETFFNIVLREYLTGNFIITGGLNINGRNIYAPNISNNYGETAYVFGGVDNTATGDNNVIVGSSSSTIEGSNNVILGGSSNEISGDYGIAIGRNVSIGHTGAVVIKDGSAFVGEDNGDDTLSLYFNNGIYIDSETFINNPVMVTGGDFSVSGYNIAVSENLNVGGSGLFTGDLNVLGTPYHTGSKLINLQDFKDHSGIMAEALKVASGILLTGSYSFITNTGDDSVSGIKYFYDNIALESGSRIKGSTGNAVIDNYIDMYQYESTRGFYVETYSLNSIVETLSSTTYTNHSGDNFFKENSFSVVNGGNNLFSVNSSGFAQFSEGINMSDGATIPSDYDDFGFKGQMVWDTDYLYVCTGWANGGNSGWCRLALGGW